MKNFITKEIIIWFSFIIALFLIGVIIKIDYSILMSVLSLFTSIFVLIYNRKLEIDKIKLSSYTLVTKLQYDLEFKIYTEIYEKIFRLYIETDKLKPILDVQTTKEDMEARLKEFANIYDITSKVINQYRPFYSERIYNLLIFIRNMCCEDAMDVRCSLDSTKKIKFDYKKSKEIKEDIKNKLNELSDLIRQRIENMKIIEN